MSKAPGFHEALRISLKRWVAGYVDAPQLDGNDYVIAPTLGDEAGVLGAIALALDMLNAR
ncbi:hypothetical protein [Sphingomonas paeninsulae]|uniref:hypothetical protein n=1 Tax=Sphingomonas paeninsulae TaxID=2319844 RepID=UPI001968D542|nr:hypothetical protein [Sphingomonas paeninsulae]